MLAINSTIRSAAAVIGLSRSCTVYVHPMLLFLQPTVVSEHLQGRIYQTAHGIAIWIFMTPLPMKCDSVTSTIVRHELFLVGGTLTTTLAMSLPDSSCCTTTKTWRTLTAPPLKRTAAITFCGALSIWGSPWQISQQSYPHLPARHK